MYGLDHAGHCANCGVKVTDDGTCACPMTGARQEIEALREGLIGIMAASDALHRAITETLTTLRR